MEILKEPCKKPPGGNSLQTGIFLEMDARCRGGLRISWSAETENICKNKREGEG